MNTIFVIFGATGDLMKRKLIPAFECLNGEKKLKGDFEVIGVGRTKLSKSKFQKEVEKAVKEFGKIKDKKLINKFSYQIIGYENLEDYKKLEKLISSKTKSGDQVIYYLSVPPNIFPDVLKNIKESGLNKQKKTTKKIAFEKPFGTNLQTAKMLNKEINEVFEENYVYRIDHYLGKEAIQNFLVLRFANHFLEPLWNNRHIDNIQITASEILGVGSRAGYYEKAGALKDMVQNHLFQMLSLIAMEPPRNLDADSIRDEKVKVFSSIKPLDGDWMENVVFGQYGKGTVDEKKVLAYNEEENIPKNSRTETFVAMKLALENWRWSGVPFYLRTGKRLEKQGTTVVVEFKKVPNILYNKSANLESNKLIIKIQPDEEISMEFNVKTGTQVKSIETKFDQKSYFKMKSPEAYENILLNIAMSDQTLFTRFDGVEKSWEIVDKLADCHENCPIIYKYESGSWGPEMADKLLEKDGRKWWN